MAGQLIRPATGDNMLCKVCGNKTGVTDSRDTKSATRRRRKCRFCGRKFTTHEHEEKYIEDKVDAELDSIFDNLAQLYGLLRTILERSGRIL